MPKILVLYHSTYGHIEAMAEAVAEGAREVDGAVVDIKRVPETVPEDLAKSSGYKLDQKAPIARIDDLKAYDAIIIGAGTRFGSAASQMRAFLDQAGGLWFSGALIGKIGGAFTATATQHGGQETTFQGLHNFFMHHGMPVVGLPYSFQAQMTLDAVHGGLALWGDDHHRRRRLAYAQRHRTGRRPVPGPAHRRPGQEAARLIRCASPPSSSATVRP